MEIDGRRGGVGRGRTEFHLDMAGSVVGERDAGGLTLAVFGAKLGFEDAGEEIFGTTVGMEKVYLDGDAAGGGRLFGEAIVEDEGLDVLRTWIHDACGDASGPSRIGRGGRPRGGGRRFGDGRSVRELACEEGGAGGEGAELSDPNGRI